VQIGDHDGHDGGAITVNTGTITLSNCIFSKNTAVGSHRTGV
jgi:hypothetical protein